MEDSISERRCFSSFGSNAAPAAPAFCSALLSPAKICGQHNSASAAIGALAENDSTFGKSIVFVGLAEGMAIYGLLVAIIILLF